MRRRYLWLLAVFMPTVLGLAALSYLFLAPDSQTEAAATSPIVRQEPLVEDTISDETVIAPIETDALSPSAPRDEDAPEAPAAPPESPQRPAHLESESSDIIGPPQLASSTAADASADASEPTLNRGPLRLASLSAAGGGGTPNTTGSSKTSDDTATAPVDVSNSGTDSSPPGDTSGSTGGDTDPNGGKGEGTGDESGAAPNTANPDHAEDPPISDSDPDDDAPAYDPIPDEHELPVVQVPEPAGIGLMLLGLLGCVAGRRRKN